MKPIKNNQEFLTQASPPSVRHFLGGGPLASTSPGVKNEYIKEKTYFTVTELGLSILSSLC